MTFQLPGFPRIDTGKGWTNQQRIDLKSIWDDLVRSVSTVGGSALAFVDTHALRVAGGVYDPLNLSVGQFFVESDRTVLYQVQSVAGVQTWVYVAGIYVAPIASLPVDLAAADAGFRFSASNTTQRYRWTGVLFIEDYELTDVVTNDVSTLFESIHRSSGAVVNNFGTRYRWWLENTADVLKLAAFQDVLWDVATSGNEGARFRFGAMRGGAAAAAIFEVSKAVTLFTGTLSWQSGTAGIYGTLFHANTAPRTYSFPDADADMVHESGGVTAHAVVLGSDGAAKVKSGPLGSATTVLHGNNTGGDPTYSSVVLTTDVSGTLAAGNGGTGITYDRFADTRTQVNQAADIGPNNFSNVVVPGTYRVNIYVEVTTLDAAAGTLTVTVNYTSDEGATSEVLGPIALTAIGHLQDVKFIQAASGVISYKTTHTGAYGTSKYALYVVFERLS